MAGMAALRAGAGLSTIATSEVRAGHGGRVPSGDHDRAAARDASREPFPCATSKYGHIDNVVQGKTVFAVGPGISRHRRDRGVRPDGRGKYTTPMVLDADGLNAFDGSAEKLNGKGRVLVITPHPGEMARLTGLSIPEVQRDRIAVARSFAREHKVTVVLKGHRTLIAQPDGEVWVNTTGNPGMATGGTGDVLTGIVAGMIAQNPQRVNEAVAAAVHLHGLAGDIACEKMGEQSLVATDLIKALPEAFQRVREI